MSCVQKVNNFTLDGCNLGDLDVKISYTRTGNILIGMDILKTLDIHIATIKTGETILLACPLDRINDEYLLELQKLYDIGTDINSAMVRDIA